LTPFLMIYLVVYGALLAILYDFYHASSVSSFFIVPHTY
jgi:hypothetical protein